MPAISVPAKVRIDNLSMPEPNTGCWIWLGTCIPKYQRASMHYKGRNSVTAARVAYQEYVAEIPEGLHVLHRCDTPLCVNPDHLWLGTHADNMADMARKGRLRQPPAAGLGVSPARAGRWRAYIREGGIQKHIGIFPTKEQAMAARDAALARAPKEE